jgi:hypothetical protein
MSLLFREVGFAFGAAHGPLRRAPFPPAAPRHSAGESAATPVGVVLRDLAQFTFERPQLAHVLAVHALRHILQRADRFLARLALGQPTEGQIEEGERGREPLGGSGAEDLARFVQRQHRGEVPLHAQATQRQHPALDGVGEPEEAHIVRRAVGQVHELAPGRHLHTHGRGQVVEGGLNGAVLHAPGHRRQTLPQHLAPAVVAKQRNGGAAIELQQTLVQRHERPVEIRRGAEGMGE